MLMRGHAWASREVGRVSVIDRAADGGQGRLANGHPVLVMSPPLREDDLTHGSPTAVPPRIFGRRLRAVERRSDIGIQPRLAKSEKADRLTGPAHHDSKDADGSVGRLCLPESHPIGESRLIARGDVDNDLAGYHRGLEQGESRG